MRGDMSPKLGQWWRTIYCHKTASSIIKSKYATDKITHYDRHRKLVDLLCTSNESLTSSHIIVVPLYCDRVNIMRTTKNIYIKKEKRIFVRP